MLDEETEEILENEDLLNELYILSMDNTQDEDMLKSLRSILRDSEHTLGTEPFERDETDAWQRRDHNDKNAPKIVK